MTHKITFIKEQLSIDVPDETTLMDALKTAGIFLDAPCGGRGTCGKCLVRVCRDAKYETVHACQTKIRSDLLVDTSESKLKHQILTSSLSREIPFLPSVRLSDDSGCYMAAFDIGTTTIASYLLDARDGIQLCTASCINPQTAYGADVISRADYTLNHGSQTLAECVQDAVNHLIRELSIKARIEPEQILQVCLVGNTCMHHIFFQFPVNSLVLAPYVPYQKGLIRGKAADYRIQIHPDGELIFLPVIAGFVGADTMGCLLAVRPDLKDDISLIIDIGTNGEIVLGNREHLVCCSTAAGPAFEGAKIHCGMRGAEGAIDHISWANGSFEVSVIGNGTPKGLCGSGLIDTIAVLRKLELIDDSGKLLTHEEAFEKYGKTIASHITEEDGKPAFVFCTDTPSVFLTQKDIREVQLAKGAIAAGILLLEKTLGITHEDIQTIYIAGAFGNYMNPESACTIGLLPDVLKDRIIPIGNAAGEGAKIALINRDELMQSEILMNQVGFVELASLPDFQDYFIDELGFPE